MNVIITGATGMVGKGVLLECLDHPEVTSVLALGRNSCGIMHPKLQERLLDNFEDYAPIRDLLAGYDACYFCLGISAAGLTEKQYTTITYHYTLALADMLYVLNPDMTFIYVSGVGTDSSEKGRMMWARVKGKVENDLLRLGFRQAYMFRPGMIIPLRGIRSRTKAYQFFYDYFLWLIKGFKALSPKSVCTTTQIGLAMIHATRFGYSEKIIMPKDIIALAEKQK